tara:strand:+ start:184 stop:1248 length:1065 start_codon:yes stop_codon:yes gene_type:complete
MGSMADSKTYYLKRVNRIICPLFFLALIVSCEKPSSILNETYFTPIEPNDELDSPAVYHGNNEAWIVVTGKDGDRLSVYDANSGKKVRVIGSNGVGFSQFAYPNGIWIEDNLMIIVERDNHRLQLFRLPDFEPLGFIGETELATPYGINVLYDSEGQLDVFVTDSEYVIDKDPVEVHGRRIRHWKLTVEGDAISHTLVNTFGDITGPGMLYEVESIFADRQHNRLMIADEQENVIKVYTMDGDFTGIILAKGRFAGDPEGIALYKCGENDGVWIFTDQSHDRNRFHLFDRKSLQYLETFTMSQTTNTDGIWLTQKPTGRFSDGVFCTLNNDKNVSVVNVSSFKEAMPHLFRCDG